MAASPAAPEAQPTGDHAFNASPRVVFSGQASQAEAVKTVGSTKSGKPPISGRQAKAGRLPLQAASRPVRRGFRLVDGRVLFGLSSLVLLPALAILLFLQFRPEEPQSSIAVSTACDDEIDVGSYSAPPFVSGLDGEIGQDTVLASGTEYLIRGTLVVPKNRKMLIEPGARLLFEQDSALEIQGALFSCGSAGEPITFTSSAGRPGSWTGIRFLNADPRSTINHALIQFAGDQTVYLENSTPTLQNVKITGSSAFPISTDGSGMPVLGEGVDLDGSPINGIEVRGGQLADRQNILWPRQSHVYVITGNVQVSENTTLEIESGTIIKGFHLARGGLFQRDGESPRLQIRGLLKAEKVQFSSVYDSRDELGGTTYKEARDPVAGDWGGIVFLQSSSKSYLRDVLVQYAGREQGAVALQASSPELTNVTIADSAWYPISSDADSFPVLNSLTLVDNYPGDAIEVRGNSRITGRQTRTWNVLGNNAQLVRVIRGDMIVEPEATLIIEPGVVIKFEPDSRLVVQGTLKAIGGRDEEERIVFTSLRDDDYGGVTDLNTGPQDDRSWDGIVFDGVDNTTVLQNSIIRYGSLAINDASPQILDNQITNSNRAAIYASVAATPTLQGNQLVDNGINGVGIYQSTLAGEQRWSALQKDGDEQLVRTLVGQITIAESSALSIESGVVIKANGDGYLIVEGDLQIRGSEAEPVVFTSVNDDSYGGPTDPGIQDARVGDWPGIRITRNGRITVGSATISFAQTALDLRGELPPAVDSLLQIVNSRVAVYCENELELPEAILVPDQDVSDLICPSQ